MTCRLSNSTRGSFVQGKVFSLIRNFIKPSNLFVLMFFLLFESSINVKYTVMFPDKDSLNVFAIWTNPRKFSDFYPVC